MLVPLAVAVGMPAIAIGMLMWRRFFKVRVRRRIAMLARLKHIFARRPRHARCGDALPQGRLFRDDDLSWSQFDGQVHVRQRTKPFRAAIKGSSGRGTTSTGSGICRTR